MEHRKGTECLGQTRSNIEARGGRPVHTSIFLQRVRTGGAFFWSRDVGNVRGHGEEDSGGPHVFLRQGTGNRANMRINGTWRWEVD